VRSSARNFTLSRPAALIRLVPLCLLSAALLTIYAVALAQGAAVVARVSSSSGRVTWTRQARAIRVVAIGEVLEPGDQVDTRGGGRVAIELSDGSLVTVQPGSVVILGDYRAAGSLRELFEITVGRVRVKINHFVGRPNPYRVNSPTASIGVRGTDFSVSVDARGDTRVVVYEGLVEVTSRSDPRRKALVEPGRGVIVRPNEDIRFFVPTRGNDPGERRERDDQQSGKAGSGNGSGEMARESAGDYERYLDSLVEPGEAPPLSRFTAFADSHLDSLENPAYATEFTAAAGRVFLIPSFSGVARSREALALTGSRLARPVDYGLILQTSLFAPLPQSPSILGGSFTLVRSGLQSFALEEGVPLAGSLFQPGAAGVRAASSSTDSTSITGSLLAARRFGSAERTSLGVGLDHASGRGSLLSLTTQTDRAGRVASERLSSRAEVERTRLRFGLTHNFTGGHKLGLFYRYGFVSSDDRFRDHTLNGSPLPLDAARTSGHSSEIGLRLRGPITKRLFYGAEATLLAVSLDERRRAGEIVTNDRDRARLATFGAGLGYAPRPQTVFSLDVAGAISHTKDLQRDELAGSLRTDERQRNLSFSVHGAVQTDVWRKLFVNASIFALTEQRQTRLLAVANVSPGSLTRDRFTIYYSDFGAGWRFTPNFLAQYIFSTDYGSNPSGHSLLLRYTFDRGGK